MIKQPYKLLLVSSIPVQKSLDGWSTMDLWAHELIYQSQSVEHCTLVSPLIEKNDQCAKAIPCDIHVVPWNKNSYKDLVEKADVVQIATDSPMHLAFAKAAIELKKPLITSISSNRMRTMRMNAQGLSWLKRIRAELSARLLYRRQKYLIKKSQGVILVGEGLKKVYDTGNIPCHITIASWVNKKDFSTPNYESFCKQKNRPLKICAAARLEKMKGIHLAIEALTFIKNAELTILGKGPEKENLHQLAVKLGVAERVFFGGTFTYPKEFFSKIQNYDMMLLTNLNDEQPRLIFDCLSQSILPICPNSTSYQSFDFPASVFYTQGSSKSLAESIEKNRDIDNRYNNLSKSQEEGKQYTIEALYEKRGSWYINDILKKSL